MDLYRFNKYIVPLSNYKKQINRFDSQRKVKKRPVLHHYNREENRKQIIKKKLVDIFYYELLFH